MSWLCFIDQDTGRAYKSRISASKSSVCLNDHVSTLDDCNIREYSLAVQRLESERKTGNVLCTIPCVAHERVHSRLNNREILLDDSSAHLRRLEGACQSNSDLLLIRMDMDLLPPTSTSLEMDHNALQDCMDDRRRREAEALQLHALRRGIERKRGRPLVFLFTYGQDAIHRTRQTLQNINCTYTETPSFSSMSDLFQFLNDM